MSDTAPQALVLRSRRRISEDAMQGIGSSRGAHISIRGGRFRLIDAGGTEKLVDTHYLDLIIVDANSNAARLFWIEPYADQSSPPPPACFSDNGIGPSTQAMMPQAPTCQVCPNNVRGTKQTFTGKPTTACENRKKLAVIIPGDTTVKIYEFQIPPGSLSSFNAYCQFISKQMLQTRKADVADFVTRVSFDPDRQFVMKFEAAEWADDDNTLKLIEYIDQNELSQPVCGRNDVACDPEQVKALLAGQPRQAIAAPAPAAERPAETHALPPRASTTAALEAPPAAPAAAPAPRARRTPAPKAEPQANGQAAQGPSDMEIPAFLRRAPETQATEQPAAPRFGIGQAPSPPPDIADALSKAMALPTRRT